MTPNLPERFVVAIDGPAGSGKSTMAGMLAHALGAISIDTGAMYRAVAVKALEKDVDPTDEGAVSEIAQAMEIKFVRDGQAQKLIVDGQDYTSKIRAGEVDKVVSIVAAYQSTRSRMVELQRAMGAVGRVVMEGRDIGSNVFPDARFKFFLTADVSARAGRRTQEIEKKGMDADHGKVLEGIELRDRLDSGRALSPLVRAPSAVEIDTTNLSVDEVLKRMIDSIGSGGYG